MKTITLALSLLLVACQLGSPAYAWDLKDLNQTVAQTNFLVNEGCSGTLIAGRYVLTAAHCVVSQYRTVERDKIMDDGVVVKEKVRIAVPGMVSQWTYKDSSVVQTTSYVYKIKATDKALDLALLRVQVPLENVKNAKVACQPPVLGEPVWSVGNSFGVLYATVNRGNVSSLQRSYRDLKIQGDLGATTDDGEHGLVQHSAVIAPGNSGGALYNDKGELVGVNVRGMPGGFGFAVPLSDVKAFLKENNLENTWSQC